MNVQWFSDIAYAALALLITVLAIYLSARLLGKFAKFLITVVIVIAVLWFIFSDKSIVQSIVGAATGLSGSNLFEMFGK